MTDVECPDSFCVNNVKGYCSLKTLHVIVFNRLLPICKDVDHGDVKQCQKAK